MSRNLKYIIYKEGDYYVSQCLNVDVSSFGDTIHEAKNNLIEAVNLYLEDEDVRSNFLIIDEALIGENIIENI